MSIPAAPEPIPSAAAKNYNPSARFEIKVWDVDYLKTAKRQLKARIYQPQGPGPLPVLLDLHGGAWCRSDRIEDACIDEPLARSGVVVAALDFRMPPDAPYPGSVADINYAIRWFKSQAARFRVRGLVPLGPLN